MHELSKSGSSIDKRYIKRWEECTFYLEIFIIELYYLHTHIFFYFFRKLFIKKGVNDWVCDVIQNINTANKQTDLEKKRELLPAQNNVFLASSSMMVVLGI